MFIRPKKLVFTSNYEIHDVWPDMRIWQPLYRRFDVYNVTKEGTSQVHKRGEKRESGALQHTPNPAWVSHSSVFGNTSGVTLTSVNVPNAPRLKRSRGGSGADAPPPPPDFSETSEDRSDKKSGLTAKVASQVIEIKDDSDTEEDI